MANDLTTRADNPALMISSPALQRLRRISMGTVTWPGSPTMTHLSGGRQLSTEERAAAEDARHNLTAALAARDDDQTRKARFAIITDLLLSKPIAGATADVGRARGGAYRDALDDVPPWAIATAVRKWRRGEYGDDRNYTWAPDEALLRKLALSEMVPLREALHHVNGLLAAIPLEEAMKAQTYAKSEYVVEGFKTLLADLPPAKGARPQRKAAAE